MVRVSNHMITFKQKNGFTLVEFLIVIGIILLLATVSIMALNSQRAKARDAKRISDVGQLTTALAFYFSDEGVYPATTEPLALGKNGIDKLCAKSEGGFVNASTNCKLETTYMSVIPGDPLANFQFIYTGSEQGYDISFKTEGTSSLGPAGTYHAHSQVIDSQPGNR